MIGRHDPTAGSWSLRVGEEHSDDHPDGSNRTTAGWRELACDVASALQLGIDTQV